MIYILIEDVIFLIALSILLIVIYRRVRHDWSFIEKIRHGYADSTRKAKVKNHVKYISRQPVDRQKIIFEDFTALAFVILIIFLIGTKSIFFAAVVSDSMVPTFHKNDLILMQNIDRSFNVGDIIMFQRPDREFPVSHRIVSIKEGRIYTAGDATKIKDWWALKEKDIVGKVITFQGEPIVISGYGEYFIIADKNQKFGPLDYQRYNLLLSIIRTYGYAIALLSILIYMIMIFKGEKQKEYKYKRNE